MRARLGDDVDDFCVKCKRLTNHVVVSLLNDEPAKVRCRTCHGDHDYRHEQAPPPKVDPRKAALFKQVAEKIGVDLPAATALSEIDGAEIDGAEINGAELQRTEVDPVNAEETISAGVAQTAPVAAPVEGKGKKLRRAAQ